MQKYIATIITKAWFCLFAVSLLLTLAACGGTPTGTGTGTTPTAAPTATPTTAPTATPTPTLAAPTPTPTPTTAASSGNSVSIKNFSFSPKSLTVKVGTKITWTNNDSITHTVTADQGAFDSTLVSGNTFSFTFTNPGTYAYHCSIHPSMTATIIVQ
jgi:plastocyanin